MLEDARALIAQGRAGEALDLLSTQHSSNLVEEAETACVVISCHLHMGELDAAESISRTTLLHASQKLGHTHPVTLEALALSAEIAAMRGRMDEAQDLASKLLSDRSAVLGPHHRDTLITRLDLIGYRGGAGEPLYLAELAELMYAWENEDPQWRDPAHLRAGLAYSLMAEPHDPIRVGLVGHFERLLGAAHPHSIEAREALARSERGTGESGSKPNSRGSADPSSPERAELE